MKKFLKLILILVVLIGLFFTVYKTAVTNESKKVEEVMWEHLGSKNYSSLDIVKVEVTHSVLSKFKGYSFWNILVIYKDEPNVYYYYTINDDEIMFSGVSDINSSGKLNKSELKHLNGN